MQIVINVNKRFVTRLGALCALGGFIFAMLPGGATASQVAGFTPFVGGATISATAMNDNFNAVIGSVNDNDTRIAALETLLASASLNGNTLVFNGVNVQIRNGAGTTPTTNGTGNLILGYNEDVAAPATRTGSHNLIVGEDHEYTGYSGAATGTGHTIADQSVCVGGQNNNAGNTAAVFGGQSNNVAFDGLEGDPLYSVIVGGQNNNCMGWDNTVISGGDMGDVDQDNYANFGMGMEIIDLGLDGVETLVGENNNFVDIGFDAQNTFIAGGDVVAGRNVTIGGGLIPPANMDIGRGTGFLSVGVQATTVVLGSSANNIAIGGPDGANPPTSGINLGIGVQNLNLGTDPAPNGNISLGFGNTGTNLNINIGSTGNPSSSTNIQGSTSALLLSNGTATVAGNAQSSLGTAGSTTTVSGGNTSISGTTLNLGPNNYHP